MHVLMVLADRRCRRRPRGHVELRHRLSAVPSGATERIERPV